jgi:2-polyprenyl-3-methyl-5-hydroxy-6-metoxy-1,4-benzoquinol methylase
MDSLSNQRALLERVSSTYRRQSVQDDAVRTLCVRSFEPWLAPHQSGLEVGCSDGLMTAMLAQRLGRLDVVEATTAFLQEAQKRDLPNVSFHHTLIEDYQPKQQYDRIFLTWILTHIIDPQRVLASLRAMLASDGLLLVAVPNARVLSRQLALHMGLIPDLYKLTENDRNHGHLRAYDRPKLNRELEAAGFETIAQGGIMLKILADFQLDQMYENGMLEQAHIEGFYQLGCEYPDLASAIYSVCRLRQ